MKYQQWNIAQRSQETCQTMERQGVPFLVAATLCARGMTDLNQVKALLSSGEDQLQDPFLLKDMDLAVARIGRALRNGEKMAVYGDYDVDGITSTCLLTHYLRDQGGDVCYYIPNRLSEGYGVNREAVDRLAQEGVRLIVTVDCGITAVEEVEYAKELGIDLVITDHHECKEELPAAVAVVDPHRKDCPYPFKDLAGVGVALKLVMALGGEKRYHALFQEYADLAAVGTVADVMKLLGENRTIVRVGLNHLKKTRRRGLYALMVEAGTLNRAINSTTVGYCLSPRINAAGRMGQAAMAVELILTENTHQAETMAHALCELNRQRQAVELEVFNQCLAMLAGRKQYDCLVLADKAWHQGVVGIVASRLAEQYACPVFMICRRTAGARAPAGPARTLTSSLPWSSAPTCWRTTAATPWRQGSPFGRRTSPPSAPGCGRSSAPTWVGRSWSPPSRSTGRSPTPPSSPWRRWRACPCWSPTAPATPSPSFPCPG